MRYYPSKPTTSGNTLKWQRALIILCGAGRDLFVFTLANFFCIYGLRYFNVVPGTIIGSFARVAHACFRATSFHLPTARFALSEMFIAFRVGAIDHAACDGAAV